MKGTTGEPRDAALRFFCSTSPPCSFDAAAAFLAWCNALSRVGGTTCRPFFRGDYFPHFFLFIPFFFLLAVARGGLSSAGGIPLAERKRIRKRFRDVQHDRRR